MDRAPVCKRNVNTAGPHVPRIDRYLRGDYNMIWSERSNAEQQMKTVANGGIAAVLAHEYRRSMVIRFIGAWRLASRIRTN
jgi:hypothetical protein